MDDPETTLLYRAPNALEAAMLAEMLEAEGISTTLAGGEAAGAFGDLPSDALLVDLWVPVRHAERARSLIRELQRREHESASAWTCVRCGERSDGDYDLCWSCGAPRHPRA